MEVTSPFEVFFPSAGSTLPRVRRRQPPRRQVAAMKEDAAPSFTYVLPVLFLEFLATSLAKGVLPHLLLGAFGSSTYSVIAVLETTKGLLAFYFCPLIGRLSDSEGRRTMLCLTVVGTCLPVCVLAFTDSLWVYVAAQALAGAFSATFALTFAYIADTVDTSARAPAYGLALATFGLSLCVGPVTGGYIFRSFSQRSVFVVSLVLTILDVVYIALVLPETAPALSGEDAVRDDIGLHIPSFLELGPFLRSAGDSLRSLRISRAKVRFNSWKDLVVGAGDVAHGLPSRMGVLFGDGLRILQSTPLLRRVSEVVFLYYCGVWALVATLMVYVTKHLGFNSVMVGQLLSAYGICTMVSEGVLVRVMVPVLGEPLCVVIGLFGFSLQCVIIAFATEPWMMYASMSGALLANLFYPSVAALISRAVPQESQGEALGALNGCKSLCEGVGPLVFGTLMTVFENTSVPGAPYLLAALSTAVAAYRAKGLPRLMAEDDAIRDRSEAPEEETHRLLGPELGAEPGHELDQALGRDIGPET